MVLPDSDGISRAPAVLCGSTLEGKPFQPYRAVTVFGGHFPDRFIYNFSFVTAYRECPTTQVASVLVWALSVSLAATSGNRFFSSSRYLDVSREPGSAFLTLCIHVRILSD